MQNNNIAVSNTNKLNWHFTDAKDGSFAVPNAEHLPPLYFPLLNSFGMKTSVTPELKGDICSTFHTYLTAATVTEELHRNTSSRNFWIKEENQNPWSATGMSVYQKVNKWNFANDEYSLEGKIGAFTTKRKNKNNGLLVEITVFVPEYNGFVELLLVTVKNTGNETVTFTPTYALPIFARSADNFRDHRQVTTMFQQNFVEKYGVRVKPKIVHDEKKHSENKTNYVVLGFDKDGNPPTDIWARLHDFIGQGGTPDNPEAVFKNLKAPELPQNQLNAHEAVGAFRFEDVTLNAGESTEFVVLHGITDVETEIDKWVATFGNAKKVKKYLNSTLKFWQETVNTVSFETGNQQFDNWVKWIAYQVKCRQVFGNSFLPDFGYGRGGRGWRDLWQDLLSIFLVDADSAKVEMLNNFKGIRIDGSNATIIGTKAGEFKADRNDIPRTWCDHGAWPVLILDFYIQQTGDYHILFQNITFWKDQFTHRSKKIDKLWKETQGNALTDINGKVYEGSLFEHILIQQLSAFFNVGEHNILLLEGGDWNDTLDMARERGESVCFHSLYAANLKTLTKILRHLKNYGVKKIAILQEILLLLDRLPAQSPVDYQSPESKQNRLQTYFAAVQSFVSGKKEFVSTEELIFDLETKADHIACHIRTHELLTTDSGNCFFNGHYDNLAQPIGGKRYNQTFIDLTSQVMPIIANISKNTQTESVYFSIKENLKDVDSLGLRLCSEFKELDMNVGRITGFVYGQKEHGSKWMQQNIMLAYGLYKQGFAEYGNEVLSEVFQLSNNTEVAKIFPGVPSYFGSNNRGAYAYLTGSSSWLLLTLTTQVFGVRGEKGDLCFYPKLLKEQFDVNGNATIFCNFANHRFKIIYSNPNLLSFNNYGISKILINNEDIDFYLMKKAKAIVNKDILLKCCNSALNEIVVVLQDADLMDNE